MAYEDSDPERRNLVLTSLAFAAFSLGGGEFHENTIQLQVINAHFTKPYVLAVMAWIMLFWFIYRYWLKHIGEFSKEFKNEFSTWQQKNYIREYAGLKLDGKPITDQDEGHHVADIKWTTKGIYISYIRAVSVSRAASGKIDSSSTRGGGDNTGETKMSGLTGWFLGLRATLECFIKKPSFSSYIVPYALSAIAVISTTFKCVL